MTLQDELNPVKAARQELGLTLERFAAEAGCSKQLLIRTEQGTYPTPSLLIWNLIRRRLKDPPSWHQFVNRYYEWQERTRQESYGVLTEEFPKEYDQHLELAKTLEGPLAYWASVSPKYPNPTQLAKAFCIPQATIFKFMSQPHLCDSIPNTIIFALDESGYSDQCIRGFQKAFDAYKAEVRERVVVSHG
jgi:transcriptional regulator with XRE-family HTH domain